MKLLMAVSADGFVARDRNDPMDWTGKQDKCIFRLLTGVGGDCVAGRVTTELLPRLDGRTIQPISSKGVCLIDAYFAKGLSDAWLLGGQTLALSAFEQGFIDEAHICYSQTSIGVGIPEQLSPWLKLMRFDMITVINNVAIKVYRK